MKIFGYQKQFNEFIYCVTSLFVLSFLQHIISFKNYFRDCLRILYPGDDLWLKLFQNNQKISYTDYIFLFVWYHLFISLSISIHLSIFYKKKKEENGKREQEKIIFYLQIIPEVPSYHVANPHTIYNIKLLFFPLTFESFVKRIVFIGFIPAILA